ncbi:MAG: hypothetical protein Q7S46_08510 [Gallionella sp.]|nr:hypothetical protein [Gallionella sp.]
MEQQKTGFKTGFVWRAATGTAKAWTYSLGITGLYRTGKGLSSKLSDAGAHVRRQLNDSPANYRHETFKQAIERQCLDEAHLIKRAKTFNTRSLSWLASMVMATAWLAWLALSGTLTLQAFIVWLGLMVMTGAKCITWRFRYSQIRDQELYGFGPWFRNPGRW